MISEMPDIERFLFTASKVFPKSFSLKTTTVRLRHRVLFNKSCRKLLFYSHLNQRRPSVTFALFWWNRKILLRRSFKENQRHFCETVHSQPLAEQNALRQVMSWNRRAQSFHFCAPHYVCFYELRPPVSVNIFLYCFCSAPHTEPSLLPHVCLGLLSTKYLHIVDKDFLLIHRLFIKI